MLLTYSITKAKRALGDVAQFVAQHFDHCNAAYRCRQEYRPRLTTFDLFFATISKTTKQIFVLSDLKMHALHYAN